MPKATTLEEMRLSVRRAFERTILRADTRVVAGDWKAPTPPNGHHASGMFEAEGEDPELVDLAKEIRAGQVVELTGPEREIFFTRLLREDQASLQEFTPLRIRACWRIVREMARISGMIAEDQTLGDMEEMSPDPWTIGGSCPQPDSSDPRVRRHWPVVEHLVGPEGLPLLPPKVPGEFIDDFGVRSDYDPRIDGQDPRLCKYVNVIEYVAGYLRISEGTLSDPLCGKRSLHGLFDPYLTRLAFPSMLQIIAWEEQMIESCLSVLVEKGTSTARNYLDVTYGLRQHETRSMIRMALGEAAHRLTSGNAEEERALMLMRLERLAAASAHDGDQRTELGALKQQAIILGLNKSDPEDLAKEFFAIVKDAANKRRRDKNLQAPPVSAELPDHATKALVRTSIPSADIDDE